MFEFIKRFFRRKKMENVQITEVQTIIRDYFNSKNYTDKKHGIEYYRGKHKILNRKRTAIGQDGKLEVIENLPNNRLIDNQYKKLVKQKVNYVLGKPLTVQKDNESYSKSLTNYFDKSFLRVLKRVGTDVYNTGLGFLYVYYGEDNKLKFKRLNSEECIPVWENNEHNELDYLIRVYGVKTFKNGNYDYKTYVEIYTKNGMQSYKMDGQSYAMNYIETKSYINLTTGEEGKEEVYNWQKLPIIAFRADELEQSLLKRVKGLQDALNELISDFANNMQENNRNTILILKEYDGENLGEFRKNLNTFGAVKVKNDGGLEKLEVTVNSSNYESIVNLLKKAIMENGGGFDSKSDTLGNNPNQLNIRSMYSDIDLEANDLETEFQASLEELLWFINRDLENKGNGNNDSEEVEFILNRDILINESQAIADIQASVGILSKETLVVQHPWTTNAKAELERLESEKRENIEDYGGFRDHKHEEDKEG